MTFREWINFNKGFRRHKKIAELAGTGYILDIGCAKRQNSYLKGIVTGLDINYSLAAARAYIDFVRGDVNDVHRIFAGRQFDCAVMGEVIEHVERPYDVLRKVSSVLRPGGRLILSTPNPCGFPMLLAEWFEMKYFYCPEHKYLFPPRWVRRMMTEAGFEVVKTKSVGIGLGRGWFLPAPASVSYNVIYMGIKKR